MTSESDYLFYPAFDTKRRLVYRRGVNDGRFSGSELHLFEFMMVFPWVYPAPIRGVGQLTIRQVDDEFHILLQDRIRESFRTYGYIAHRRIRTNRTDPCDCYYIVLGRLIPTTHHYGWQWIDHGSRFPIVLHNKNCVFIIESWELRIKDSVKLILNSQFLIFNYLMIMSSLLILRSQ